MGTGDAVCFLSHKYAPTLHSIPSSPLLRPAHDQQCEGGTPRRRVSFDASVRRVDVQGSVLAH